MSGDTLLPGHERKPAHPLPEGPRPGTPYGVGDNEDWASVARKHGVAVRGLIANNCGVGATPEEINWYLNTRVGCRVTRDRRNWAFSDSARPGIICVPLVSGKPAIVRMNPKINTLYAGPKDLGCGGISWMVEFELPEKAGADGWIVQQILRSYDIRLADGSVADKKLNEPKTMFWEAWQVKKGSKKTANRYSTTDEGVTYDDAFDQPKRPNLKGEYKVVALVKYFETALPKTFVKKNAATRAEDLPSTTSKPDFWDGTGTVHNLSIRWDCTVADPKPANIITDVHEKEK
jgi:hypothetical protein